MHAHKILNIYPPDLALQKKLSQALNISSVLAQLLINRGFQDPLSGERFFQPDLSQLHDPFIFRDMPVAVKLLKDCARNKERVLICGDYDVDGITSIAVLKKTFERLGIPVLYYVPHRVNDGYGLNANVLHIVREQKIKLVVTADCGSSSHQEIKELAASGVKVIITDHHQPSAELPPEALAVLNPKAQGSGYSFKDLAGVGVAYKLCQALDPEGAANLLDLVALGTIADVVPLIDENRIIVKEGLNRITRDTRVGLRSLIEVSRISGKEIKASFVSFILGPRLNASGRIDTAETALKLLLCEDKAEADTLARSIDAFNRQRQKIEGKIMEEAQELIDREVNFKDQKVIVVAKEGWHQGVLGIVASKLADRFYRPAIVISLSGDLCKGSGRSIRNFHLFEALCDCREYLHAFGGHSHAAGLVVARDNIEEFRQAVNRIAQNKLFLEDIIPAIDIDMEIDFSQVNISLVNELKRFEPFGQANPEPLFLARGLKLKGEPVVLGRETLKFFVSDGTLTHQVIAFGMAELKESLLQGNFIDLVFVPQIDSWKGPEVLILEAKEIFLR